MGLSYHFTLSAPASAKAAELEQFLKTEEAKAQTMGFHPTMVLNVPFDTVARREFARRLTFAEMTKAAPGRYRVRVSAFTHDAQGRSLAFAVKTTRAWQNGSPEDLPVGLLHEGRDARDVVHRGHEGQHCRAIRCEHRRRQARHPRAAGETSAKPPASPPAIQILKDANHR